MMGKYLLFLSLQIIVHNGNSLTGHNLRHCQRHETNCKGKGAKMFQNLETT